MLINIKYKIKNNTIIVFFKENMYFCKKLAYEYNADNVYLYV